MNSYDLLPPNQKIFVDEYVKDRNGKRAAIAAGYSPKTAEQQASRLLRNVKVKAAIEERLLAAQKRREETLDDILNELDENRRVALSAETPQASAATAATLGKAKLLGFMVDKSEVTGKDGAPLQHQVTQSIDLSNLTEDQLRAIASIKINGG